MTEAFFYDAKGRDQLIELADATIAKLGKQQLLWIDATRDDAGGLDAAAAITRIAPEARTLIDNPPSPPAPRRP